MQVPVLFFFFFESSFFTQSNVISFSVNAYGSIGNIMTEKIRLHYVSRSLATKNKPLADNFIIIHQDFSNHIFPNSVANSLGKCIQSTAKETKSAVPTSSNR